MGSSRTTRWSVDSTDDGPLLSGHFNDEGGEPGQTLPSLKWLRNYDGGWDKFYRFVWEGRKNTAMAAFKGILSPDEVRALYEYLTLLPRQ